MYVWNAVYARSILLPDQFFMVSVSIELLS